MYRYDADDRRFVESRAAQLGDQIARHLAGGLSADALRPLRLLNGLYVERNGPMLRIAVPYGNPESRQLRALARAARTYGRGYGHFTTRHNFQLDWLKLEDAPQALKDLARVDLHGIQSSGSCVRNVTSDPLAGVAPDEEVDPRPWCELLRQWSAGHPEFAALPRKLKIAVSGSADDRALLPIHDIGLRAMRNEAGEIGFRVLVGGGLGRAPILAWELQDFLPWQDLLAFVESVCRFYNRDGRRDNPNKGRLKFLVAAIGIEEFRRRVEIEWSAIRSGPLRLTAHRVEQIARHFGDKPYLDLPVEDAAHAAALAREPEFAAWVRRSVQPHKRPGYAIVTLSTKRLGNAPGDASSDDLERLADWADDFSFGELRVTQRQNLVLADVRLADLHALWVKARATGFGQPDVGLLTDVLACPGADYCSLANARSLPLAEAIRAHFSDEAELLERVGNLRLNLSGCMNGCAHHQIGDIGLRGVDKRGVEHFQVRLGGAQGRETRFGERLGPALPAAEVPAALERIVSVYLAYRVDGEGFGATVARIGVAPFKEAAYGSTPELVRSGSPSRFQSCEAA